MIRSPEMAAERAQSVSSELREDGLYVEFPKIPAVDT